MFRTKTLFYLAKPATQPLVSFRAFKQRLSERAKVKSGAADEDRRPASAFDLRDNTSGIGRPIGGGIIDPRIDVIYKMMRDAMTLFCGGLGGCDLNTAIYLHRIEINDLTANSQGQLYRKRGLSRRGRSGDRIDRFFNVSDRQFKNDSKIDER